MNPDNPQEAESRTVCDPECETVYSLEVVAELAGLSIQTVLHYHEIGVVSPATEAQEFDTDGLRELRRIEHLRRAHELSDSGLRFVLNLLREVEQLRQELRQAHSPQRCSGGNPIPFHG